MTKNSKRRPVARLGVTAAAVVVGAGVAFAYTATSGLGTMARSDAAQPLSRGVPKDVDGGPQPTTTSPPTSTRRPPPSEILPFNAKLTSSDIPVEGGGVRDGACSGSLIAPEWVVTAGHCFHDLRDVRIGGKPPYHMKVVVGKLKDSDPGGYITEVVDVRQSPLNDLAVVKLSEPIPDIVPLTLADKKPTIGQRLQFAGWGSLSATVIAPSDHLKRGRFTVAKIEPTVLEASPVVTRTVENSPCPEDSGAPYFVSDDDRTGVLVAIVNGGPSCPQAGREIIARVDVVADWIREQMVSSR